MTYHPNFLRDANVLHFHIKIDFDINGYVIIVMVNWIGLIWV